MEEITTVRKDRVDRGLSTDEPGGTVIKRGPTHRIRDYNQTWCGRKIKGLATWKHKASPEDVDCAECKKAIAADKPRAWKRY